MSIQDCFCPKCGKPSEHEGLCNLCRIGNTPWFTCDRRVKSTHCPSCGALKQVNTWTDTTRERGGLAPELAKAAVHFHPDVRKPSMVVKVEDNTLNRSTATIDVKGLLYNTPVEGTCSVELIWHKEQCDRCNRISGSYYEGIVQVRAHGRLPSTFELQMSAGIAQQVEDSLQAGGERLSFIVDMNETREGLDITVGSQHIGTLISQGIIAQLGGRFTTHPKLVGEKNGRQLYRITYSVRLPRFQKQDVVLSHGRYFEVVRVESNHLKVLDLTEGIPRAVREEEVERLVGNLRDAESALVAFADAGIMGILDPETCQTKEFRKLKWLDVKAGQHVLVLRDGDHLVVVG
ncbi:MAG TPA: 60S ribosomal export protein NMD3 [Methanoregula sp.]|nr:60S ribosomal export protein NMD3 [Methanoregula sp.]